MTDQNATPKEKLEPFNLDGAILEVFQIPICITQELTAGFILDLVDFATLHPEWRVADPADKYGRVQRSLERLEEEGKLKSKMTKVKTRQFEDDEETPDLPQRVRVYALVR